VAIPNLNNMEERTLLDAIEGYIAGDNPIKVTVGLDAESAIKFGIVAVVTALIIVLIIRKIK
jgi:hypothetical protein